MSEERKKKSSRNADCTLTKFCCCLYFYQGPYHQSLNPTSGPNHQGLNPDKKWGRPIKVPHLTVSLSLVRKPSDNVLLWMFSQHNFF